MNTFNWICYCYDFFNQIYDKYGTWNLLFCHIETPPLWTCPKLLIFCWYIYIYIFNFNASHQFPLGCDIDLFPRIPRSSCGTYHPMMDLLWGINEYTFNGCVSISSACLHAPIRRMDIVKLATYARKWHYFTLIYFYLASWMDLGPIIAPHCYLQIIHTGQLVKLCHHFTQES